MTDVACLQQALCARFWGDNWYDHRTKSWSPSPISEASGAKLKRGFVEFVLDPIYALKVRSFIPVSHFYTS